MHKIDYNNGCIKNFIDELLKKYTEYLGKDLVELLKKIKDTKPDFITEEETVLIFNSIDLFDDIHIILNNFYDNI